MYRIESVAPYLLLGFLGAVYLGTVVVGSLATGLVVDFVLDGQVLTGMAPAAIESVHRHADGTTAMGWGFDCEARSHYPVVFSP